MVLEDDLRAFQEGLFTSDSMNGLCHGSTMALTIEEAQARLPEIVAKAAAGEEVLLARSSGQLAVQLVPVTPKSSRLTQHTKLKGSLIILDHEALVRALPAEEWGNLAN